MPARPRAELGLELERCEVRVGVAVLDRRGDLGRARNSAFARLYDLPEQECCPRAVLDTPTPDDADAFRELVRISAQSLGIAAETELRDYFG